MADIGEINATKTQHNDFEHTPISKYRTLGLYMRSYLHLVFTYMCMVPCEILFFYRVSRHFEFDSYKILPKGANFAPGWILISKAYSIRNSKKSFLPRPNKLFWIASGLTGAFCTVFGMEGVGWGGGGKGGGVVLSSSLQYVAGGDWKWGWLGWSGSWDHIAPTHFALYPSTATSAGKKYLSILTTATSLGIEIKYFFTYLCYHYIMHMLCDIKQDFWNTEKKFEIFK